MAELTDEQISRVTQLVANSGQQALRWFRPARSNRDQGAIERLSVDNKEAQSGGFDPVTEADRAVERMTRQALAELFPDDAITGEEFGSTGSGRRRWFIDPVDGTRAFVSGQPMWGTLVGLVADGTPVAGWMHLPVLDETYVGIGDRATLVYPRPDKPDRESAVIQTTSTNRLDEAILLCTHPSMFNPGAQSDRFNALATATKMVRFGGDCMNYGLLASGDADLVVENQLAPYDIIPLIPIITAAGGAISNLDGNVPIDGGFVVAAANQNLHQAALEILNS